jgi:hypothetical protein
MEHFRDKADTAENQERRVQLIDKFTAYAPFVLSRHETLVREFYSPARQIEEPISVPTFIDGQQVLPIPEFSK